MNSKSHYSKEEEVEYWDSRQLLKEEKQALGWVKKGSTLDIGCGSGVFLKYLGKEGLKELVGLDISLEMVKRAKANGFSSVNGSSAGLPFKKNKFNYLLMLQQVIEHIPKKEERLLALKEAHSALRKNGKLIVSIHLTHRSFKKMLCRLLGVTAYVKDHTRAKGRIPFHFYFVGELIEDLDRNNFKIVDYIIGFNGDILYCLCKKID